MVDDLFDVFLDSVYKYFVEYFCICVHKGSWFVIFMILLSFRWFGYHGHSGLLKGIGNACYVSIL